MSKGPPEYECVNDLEDGAFAIADSQDRNVVSGNVVLAIIDDRATIKRFIDDRANGQIVLVADSSFDYAPIYLHPQGRLHHQWQGHCRHQETFLKFLLFQIPASIRITHEALSPKRCVSNLNPK